MLMRGDGNDDGDKRAGASSDEERQEREEMKRECLVKIRRLFEVSGASIIIRCDVFYNCVSIIFWLSLYQVVRFIRIIEKDKRTCHGKLRSRTSCSLSSPSSRI